MNIAPMITKATPPIIPIVVQSKVLVDGGNVVEGVMEGVEDEVVPGVVVAGVLEPVEGVLDPVEVVGGVFAFTVTYNRFVVP